jgi:hypothetical protein
LSEYGDIRKQRPDPPTCADVQRSDQTTLTIDAKPSRALPWRSDVLPPQNSRTHVATDDQSDDWTAHQIAPGTPLVRADPQLRTKW